jgi:phosphoribosylanthranilate isomerase
MNFIKICGIKSEEQAIKIAELGATHIGVIHFPKSPRHIDLDKIKSIKESLQNRAKLVAVVVKPEEELVKKLLDIVDIIQFHGDEPLEFIKKFPKDRVIKVFRVKSFEDIEKMKPFWKEDYLTLIDTFKKDEYGGTGERIDIELAKSIINQYPKTILSGGLSPDNLEDILPIVKPYGVDASSKLEVSAGVKDLEKVKRFINIAKRF